MLFLFHGSDLLVLPDGEGYTVPTADEAGISTGERYLVGELGGAPCYAADLPAPDAAAGGSLMGLRPLNGRISPALWRMAGRAFQYVEWDRTHRFCGRCGSPTRTHETELSKVCTSCGETFYPRLSPAVIVLVRDGDRALLARSHRFPPGRYSTIAGFVEPGETLEEAVQREVREETGVEVANIRYFGSQPWPFPHSLMLGFTADYAGGEIAIEEKEIADARWFHPDGLPDLPPPYSIARRLIEGFVASCRNR